MVEATPIETARGIQHRFTEEQLAAARELRCTYPGCTDPAPTPSRRCGQHAARVKDPPERRFCKRCGKDLGVIHGSRIKAGRGKYCPERCWPAVRDAQVAELGPTANLDGAREHHAGIAEEVRQLEAEGLYTFLRASEVFGIAEFTLWSYSMRGTLAYELREFSGSLRALVRDRDVRALIRWLREEGRIARLNQPAIVIARLDGRGVLHRAATAGLGKAEIKAAYERRVQARTSKLNLRLSPGKAPNEKLRRRLESRIAEVAAEEIEVQVDPDLEPSHVARAAAVRDRLAYPEIWPIDRYGSMVAPYDRKKVIERVFAIVSRSDVAALIERERIRAAARANQGSPNPA